jgi:ribosome-binding factor A
MERSERVAEEIRNVVADVLRNDIRDPRLPEIVSVTYVKVTRDLSHATLYYSAFGSEEDKAECDKAVQSASSFIRREIARRIKLRIAPELHFKRDESIEHGMRMDKLIDETLKNDMEKRKSANQE